MSSIDGSISIRPSDLAPVTRWLAELRGRVVDWSSGVKAISSEEWNRLQGSVKGALSTRRVEQVLKDFLKRVGVSARSEELVGGLSVELRSRILSYREGSTIESYPNFISEPPKIKL